MGIFVGQRKILVFSFAFLLLSMSMQKGLAWEVTSSWLTGKTRVESEVKALPRLYVIEEMETERSARQGCVLAYTFKDGQTIKREVILEHPMKSFSNEFGTFYGNSFLILHGPRSITVIDLKSGKIAFENAGRLITIKSDELIVWRSVPDEKSLKSYNFQTGVQTELSPGGKWEFALGYDHVELSPDRTKALAGNEDVFLFPSGGTKTKIVSGLKNEIPADALYHASVPKLWLDNVSFLTQERNGKIIKVDLKGEITPITQIEIEELPRSAPRLYRDAIGRIVYHCGGRYVIVPEQRKHWPIEWEKLGHDFEVSLNLDKTFRRIQHKGQLIDKLNHYRSYLFTTDDHIATECADREGGAGIFYWSAHKKEWQRLKTQSDSARIIGWGK